MPWRNGFTMLELVVSVTVFSLVATLSVPFLHAFVLNYRLKGAAFALRSDLIRVKSQARAENRQYRVVFDGDGYRVLRSDNPFTFVLDEEAGDGGVALRRSFSRFPGVILKHASAAPVFHPRGVATVPATITLANSRNQELKTRVSIAGRVMVTP
jgi:prepilin-type N-terminal cleavage/methylation domain-containing protein